MTEEVEAGARLAANPGTDLRGYAGVDRSRPSWHDSSRSAAAVLDLLRRKEEPSDGVVLAGFGGHGRDGARKLLDVPVVDGVATAVRLAESLVVLGLTTSRGGLVRAARA